MRFSIREFFLVTTAAAVAMPLLCFANNYTRGAVVAVTALVGFAMLVRALVERGARQVSAIGFVAVAGGYAAIILLTSDGKDVNPYSSKFPTVQVLQTPLTWIQQHRGIEPPPPGVNSFVARRYTQPRPWVTDFVPIAHSFWALLLGYLGAKYAAFIYTKRGKRMQSA